MLRHVLTLASITILTSACGATVKVAPRVARASTPAPAPKKPATKVVAKTDTPADPVSPEANGAAAEPATLATKDEPPKAVARKLGDFHVYQYSGTFSKQILTLTEQVVAMDNDVLVVDFVLEEGTSMSALRVRMKPDNDVVSVSRITDEGEAPATIADYDAMMKRTQFAPDSNDEVLAKEHTSCLVGEEQVDCDVTTYHVTYGHKHATLAITTSDKLPGRDIGGDVVGEDGKVLYSARLVERGNEPPVVEALAKLDRFMPTEP
jgi:hypothetical protein